jgi:hypothetical protein
VTNPFQPRHHVNGTVAHQFTTQDGVTKVIIRTDAGQHTDPQVMPFSAEPYEGRRVRLIDGVWRLEARAA